MADAANIPIIGPYLGFVGIGNKKSDDTVSGTLRGRTRAGKVVGGKIVPIRPASEVPRSIYGDALNQALADSLAGWAAGYQERAGLTNVGPHPPAEVGPLPPPELVNPAPIVIEQPFIDLPPELPEVVVSPPTVSPPAPIVEPAPLEVPLEEITLDPYALPSVLPGARPGSAPSTSSPPRVNPVPSGSPFPGNLLGIGAAFAVSLAGAPGVAFSPAPSAGFGGRAAPRARPGSPPGVALPPGSAFDFVTPGSPSIVPPVNALPGLNFSLGAQPSPQQQTERDKCKCDEKKKKKSEPRQPRTKCFRGTFRQRSKGISYSRGEEIPCDGPLPKKAGVKPAAPAKLKSTKGRAISAATKYAKRGKAPSLGELARDVLGF